MTFVFSCDAHIIEPRTLFRDGMPPELAAHMPAVIKEERYIMMKVGDRIVHRVPIGGETSVDRDPAGASDLDARVGDMEKDGIDGELLFPTMGLLVYFVENPDAELSACQVYNDWLIEKVAGKRNRFVPAAILPARDFTKTVAEIERLATLGYTCGMLPTSSANGFPPYNDPAWDPVFEALDKHNMVVAMHTGSGQTKWVFERGAGGAVINYAHQMNDAIGACIYLVSGGLLDRYPNVKVMFIEAGASWLAAVSERMDEVYHAHHDYVRPKLNRLPSQIVRDQIRVSFQNDRACVLTRDITGHEALLWASDYPHMEGTWPNSDKVRARLFDGVAISDREKSDILGGNAARLLRLENPLAAD